MEEGKEEEVEEGREEPEEDGVGWEVERVEEGWGLSLWVLVLEVGWRMM